MLCDLGSRIGLSSAFRGLLEGCEEFLPCRDGRIKVGPSSLVRVPWLFDGRGLVLLRLNHVRTSRA